MTKSDLKILKEKVFEANLNLQREKLVIFTFGNVSGIDRKQNIIAIKPSGVNYKNLKPADMVLVSLDGKIIDSDLNPSSDTKTHLQLYRSFPEIGGVAHTHSRYATILAQACMPVLCLGTTHADYFYGDIPCTDIISDESINKDYEDETGRLIVDTFIKNKLDYNSLKACLVASHGPFTWGDSPDQAVFISAILEEVATQNCFAMLLNPGIKTIKSALLDKHYSRKHGMNAYYGQKGKK